MYSVNVSWFFTMSVSTFGNLRIYRLFAAPRSLSQLVTSFFGSWCQGIHLMLLFAWTSFWIFFSCSLWIAWVSLNIVWFSFRSKKVWSFLHFFFPSGWDFISFLGNCSSLPKFFGKTYSNLLLKCVLFYLFVSTHFTSLFGFQWTLSFIGFGLSLKLNFWVSLHQLLAAGTACWWAQVDSNHRPRAYQARALTTWAMSPLSYFRCISSLSPFVFLPLGF